MPGLDFINQASIPQFFTMMDAKFNQGLELYKDPAYKFLVKEDPTNKLFDKRVNIMSLPGPRKWENAREYRHMGLTDYTITTDPYELTIEVGEDEWLAGDFDRTSLIDVPTAMLERCQQAVERAAYAMLPAGVSTVGPDEQFFFDTDHPVKGGVYSNTMGGAGVKWYLVNASSAVYKPVVAKWFRRFRTVSIKDPSHPLVFEQKKYAWGVDYRVGFGYGAWQNAVVSGQDLTEDNFQAAWERLMLATDEEGHYLNNKATHLVVPVTLELKASKLFLPTYSGGGDNPLRNKVQVISVPYLPNVP